MFEYVLMQSSNRLFHITYINILKNNVFFCPYLMKRIEGIERVKRNV